MNLMQWIEFLNNKEAFKNCNAPAGLIQHHFFFDGLRPSLISFSLSGLLKLYSP